MASFLPKHIGAMFYTGFAKKNSVSVAEWSMENLFYRFFQHLQSVKLAPVSLLTNVKDKDQGCQHSFSVGAYSMKNMYSKYEYNMVVRPGLKIPSRGVSVRHHKACRVMSNSHPKWQNFQFARNSHYGFFFLHTLPLTNASKLEDALFYQF